ncbi:MAG: cysteine--tRNA ligase [Candidatus Peribacteraceae bacterium]|nr:cysteine--tRNA ligase [Candidatus Peribacteraceae bacterium]
MPEKKPSSLRLYNTLHKKEEAFEPITAGKVAMYTCGPTVYGRPHIGNYASFLMADLLRRWLEVSGYNVTHVKNITDVGHLLHDADQGDDKVQKQAEREKVHPLEIARRFEREFLEDEKAINMHEPEHRPRASEYVQPMLVLVKKLLASGHAYETADGIYFSIESFPQYGALSGNTLENLSAGARIEVKEVKKHPADFALWKKCVGDNGKHILRWSYATGEVSTTEGEDPASGFPGWHIECSAMSSTLLGEQIDIHTGGEDNIFPHHECEIAQSEASSGKQPFVKYWVHRRRINMGEEKMSKSLGNVLSLPDIVAKGFSPLDLRYYLLSVHYRTNLKFTERGLDDARKARRKIMEWMEEVRRRRGEEGEERQEGEEGKEGKGSKEGAIVEWQQKFTDAMNADLNTPAALAIVFDAMAWARQQLSCNGLEAFIETVRKTFGCFEPEEGKEIPVEVQKLVDARAAARAEKDFKKSDALRVQIRERGYEVRDVGGEQEVRKI